MISARSLNTRGHQREAKRDWRRKSNYPGGNMWLSTAWWATSWEQGLRQLLRGTRTAAFLCALQLSSWTFPFPLIATYKLVVGLLRVQKHTYGNLIIDCIRKSSITNCRRGGAILQRDTVKLQAEDDFLCESINDYLPVYLVYITRGRFYESSF